MRTKQQTGAATTSTSPKKGAKLCRYHVSMDVVRNRDTGEGTAAARLAAARVEDAVVSEVRRMEAGGIATIQELAGDVGRAERHVSRLRPAYLAPEVLERLTSAQGASAVSLNDPCFLAEKTWQKQAARVFR